MAETTRTTSTTSLHAAALAGEVEVVRRLLSEGADIDAHDADGNTPLDAAIHSDDLEVARLLVSKGGRANGEPYEGSIYSQLDNDYMESPWLPVLVDAGLTFPINFLRIALQARDRDAIRALVEKGLGISDADGYCYYSGEDSRTALQLILSESWSFDWSQVREWAELLLARGARIDAPKEDGNTALHLAAETGNLPVAEYLLSRGADANAHNGDGETPVDLALREEDADMIRLLLRPDHAIDTTGGGQG